MEKLCTKNRIETQKFIETEHASRGATDVTKVEQGQSQKPETGTLGLLRYQRSLWVPQYQA